MTTERPRRLLIVRRIILGYALIAGLFFVGGLLLARAPAPAVWAAVIAFGAGGVAGTIIDRLIDRGAGYDYGYERGFNRGVHGVQDTPKKGNTA